MFVEYYSTGIQSIMLYAQSLLVFEVALCYVSRTSFYGCKVSGMVRSLFAQWCIISGKVWSFLHVPARIA